MFNVLPAKKFANVNICEEKKVKKFAIFFQNEKNEINGFTL